MPVAAPRICVLPPPRLALAPIPTMFGSPLVQLVKPRLLFRGEHRPNLSIFLLLKRDQLVLELLSTSLVVLGHLLYLSRLRIAEL